MILDIVVIGAGIGGLAAATFCAKEGHNVTVLEKRSEIPQQGGGIGIQPSAVRVVKHYGLGDELAGIGNRSSSVEFRDGHTMKSIKQMDLSDFEVYGVLRAQVVSLFYHAAISSGVKVLFNQSVGSVADEKGTKPYVELVRQNGERSGRRLEADLIICADGCRSRSRAQVLSDVMEPIDLKVLKSAAYAVTIPLSRLQTAPGCEGLIDKAQVTAMGLDGCYIGFSAFKQGLWMGTYCVEDMEQYKPGVSYDPEGDLEVPKSRFKAHDPRLMAALRLAEDGECQRWQTSEVPDLPRWTSATGRIVLLGDSAHGMNPTVGQGASTAIEDGGSLAHLLSSALLSDISQIPAQTLAWQKSRKARVEDIKALSTYNAHNFVRYTPRGSTSKAANGRLKDHRAKRWAHPEYMNQLFKFDALAEAERALTEAAAESQTSAHL